MVFTWVETKQRRKFIIIDRTNTCGKARVKLFGYLNVFLKSKLYWLLDNMVMLFTL